MRTFIVLFILAGLTACSRKAKDKVLGVTTANTAKNDTAWFPKCEMSNESFSFDIDSCNCSDMSIADDTVIIDLHGPASGDIQKRLLKIDYPECDSTFYILMKHQNRYCVSSMGPDPLLTDWILYNSPYDTLRYDNKLGGFLIDSVPEAERSKFPAFDTLSFYKAYERAIGENLSLDYVPDIAKNAMYREYRSFKHHAEEVLQQSYVELHRVILELYYKGSLRKVFIFNYGHLG
ncbi:hypothetical protein [Ferruginibacter albus]|uniref:hypothetical protein n=1 Tax=Ferruginibacter albus TaxID=2875540 RepID=UPI001CC7D103|nr:hypothetical protein [Ferruginibacter albus]UAY51635.1 hypothetical protein K9M53_13695 [Ferruginibacter albus]